MKWLSTERDAEAFYGALPAIQDFNAKLGGRLKKYPNQTNLLYPDITYSLDKKGWYIWRDCLDIKKIEALREQAERHFRDGTNLKLNDAHYAFVDQPMLNAPAAFDIGFSDLLLDVSTAFYGTPGAHGTCNLRLSRVNDLPATSTSKFHVDKDNSISFFKAFAYLTETDETNAFTIVEGSHKKRHPDWQSKYRWEDNEIENLYGKENIKRLTGKPGDVIFASTLCYHKGQKALKERIMMTYNLVCHEELNGGRAVIKKEDYDRLPERLKPLGDFCVRQ